MQPVQVVLDMPHIDWKKFFIYLMPESLEPSGLMQFLSTDYKFAVSFIILVVVLLIRPTGIFKGQSI